MKGLRHRDGNPNNYDPGNLEYVYSCPHEGCRFWGNAVEVPVHVETDHAPLNLGDPRYGR